MRLLKRLLAILVLVLVLAFGLLFAVQNSDRVPLDLLVIQLGEQRLSLWILLAFIAGGCIGMLISSLAIIRLRSRIMLLQRKLNKNDQASSSQSKKDSLPAVSKR